MRQQPIATNQPGEGEVTRPLAPLPARAHSVQIHSNHRQRPMVVVHAVHGEYQRGGRPWKNTLCSCNCGEFIQSVFCPCILAGGIWKMGLEKSYGWGIAMFLFICISGALLETLLAMVVYTYYFSVFWLPPILYALLWTGPLRQKGNIAGEFCGDCCACCWCPCCQLIREHREAEDLERQREAAAPAAFI